MSRISWRREGRIAQGEHRGHLCRFSGQEAYPTVEEKAANLLYFIIKNHSFLDGNKRIAAALFLYFLDRNCLLFDDEGNKLLADEVLVALMIMLAESRPQEKELMISLVMNFLVG